MSTCCGLVTGQHHSNPIASDELSPRECGVPLTGGGNAQIFTRSNNVGSRIHGAKAADLPVKAPPIIAAEYNWTGIYGGINAGWIEDHYRWQYTNPAPATCCAVFDDR
jgi:hypothetical protein